jgi:membrane protein
MKKVLRNFISGVRDSVRFVLRTFARTSIQMKRSDIPLLASSLSFGTTMSMVPLLAVSLSVFKAYGGFDVLLKRFEPFILQNFVEASGAQVSNIIHKSIARIHSGTLGVGGAIFLLVVSTKLFLDMDKAVHRVWEIESNRSFLRRLVVYWIVMFLGPLVLAVALGVAGSKDLGLIKHIGRNGIAVGFTFCAFLMIYKWIPSTFVHWRNALFSAVVAAFGVGLAQAFYASITKTFLRYSKIYGSIASVPIFLVWIQVLWLIFLAGVALCATLEKQNAKAGKVA